jgi:hypothetical protein
MLVNIKISLNKTFRNQLRQLVKVFQGTINGAGDFLWVDPDEYFIDLGNKKCTILFCRRFYNNLEMILNDVPNWSFSLGKIRKGVSLYRSDMIYFSLGEEADLLRELANNLEKKLQVNVKHPFIPRITIAYSKENYGVSALNNINGLIKTFNRELLDSDFSRKFQVESVSVFDENQKVLRKFLVNSVT